MRKNRKGYLLKIIVPKWLEHDLSASARWMAAFWQSLPKSVLRHLFGFQEHISLEIAAEARKLWMQIWVPYAALIKVVTGQIRAHIPDAEIQLYEEEIPRPEVFATAELVLGLERERSLKTLKKGEADPMAGILGALSDLSGNERALIQILVRPALAASMETLAFQTIIRLFASSTSRREARNRLGTIIAAFGQFGAENALKPTRIRINSRATLRALLRRRWPFYRLNPSTLTLEELVAIFHIPSPSKVHNPYLEIVGAKRLPPPPTLHSSGARVGVVSVGGQEREIHLSPEDLIRHAAIFGSTGTGKSTFLLNVSLDLIKNGYGLTVMDPHASLVPVLLARLPEARADDVIVVRFADPDYAVGLNFLPPEPNFEFLFVDQLVEILRRSGGEYWGPVLDMVVRHAAFATLETGGTLVEMTRLLDDDFYRESVIPQIRNPETKRFFRRLSTFTIGRREQNVASTLNRLQRLVGTPLIRNIVGQRRSTIDFREVMDEGKILILDLAGIGVNNAKFLGSLITLLYRQAALSRQEIPESQRVPHFLIMDECSWFISRTVGEMADEMRKFGLGLILAAQRLGQLKPQETREAVFANVGNLICFEVGERDEAVYLARHFNTADLTADQIRSLGRYEIYAKLTVAGQKQPAFWARTLPPPTESAESTRRIQRLIDQSRRRYALPREVVEGEIISRERGEIDEEPEIRPRQRYIAAHSQRQRDLERSGETRPDDQGTDSAASLPKGW